MSLLQTGSTGTPVRELQARLNALNAATPPLSVDGAFGPLTRSAVLRFQGHTPGLKADGIVGPLTWQALAVASPLPPPVMLHHVVPGAVHVAQDKDNSCWFASARMLVEWQRRRTGRSDPRVKDPAANPTWLKLYGDDTGITNDRIRSFARDIGLVPVPPMSPRPESVQDWLRRHGPLWVNGKRHITVIAGIRGPADQAEVLVLDPARPLEISGSWRKLREWYVLDGWSGRDTAGGVEAVFLHLP